MRVNLLEIFRLTGASERDQGALAPQLGKKVVNTAVPLVFRR